MICLVAITTGDFHCKDLCSSASGLNFTSKRQPPAGTREHGSKYKHVLRGILVGLKKKYSWGNFSEAQHVLSIWRRCRNEFIWVNKSKKHRTWIWTYGMWHVLGFQNSFQIHFVLMNNTLHKSELSKWDLGVWTELGFGTILGMCKSAGSVFFVLS